MAQLDESTFLVSGPGGNEGTATLVTVTEGLVSAMQQITSQPRDAEADAWLPHSEWVISPRWRPRWTDGRS